LGERACPGAAFATQEAVLILAKIVQRYQVEPDAKHKPRPVARLTLRSGNGIVLKLTRLAEVAR
jgi:cytochrome P450